MVNSQESSEINKKIRGEVKANSKIVELKHSMSVITLDANGLTPLKKADTNWITEEKKQNPMSFIRDEFKNQHQNRLKVYKIIGKDIQWK